MRKDVVTIDVGVSALEASKIMLEKSLGSIVVLERTQPAGIITERDLVLKVMAKQKDPSKVEVCEIMSKPLVTISPDANVADAAKIMAKHGIRRLPVVRGNVVCGMLTARDLATHYSEYEDRIRRDIIRHMSLVSLPL